MLYTIHDATTLCARLYEPLKSAGLFVGVTGGTVYKPGPRKDIDLVLYRHRQDAPMIEDCVDLFVEACGFAQLKVSSVSRHGFVTKLVIDGTRVDLLFPEAEYTGEDEYGE